MHDERTSQAGFLDRLRGSRVVQWALAYAAAAWVLLQVAELVAGVFGWPAVLLRQLTVLLVFGFAAAVIVAWYHGHSGRQSVSAVEVSLLAAIGVAALWVLSTAEFRTEEERAARESTNRFENKASRRLTASAAYAGEPAWSPDGAALVYVASRAGNRDLWLERRGQAPFRLTEDPGEDAQPAWSPDASAVLFVSSREHGARLDRSVFYGYTIGGDIYSVPAFGGEPRKIVDDGFNPAWSPDGKRIAFDSSRGGSRRIWIADANGSSAVQVTQDADLVSHVRPAWSPDGRWIAYEQQTDTQASAVRLAIVDAETGQSFHLTDGQHRDMAPAWTGAGSLVFASDRSGALNLWLLDVDLEHHGAAGTPVQVTRGAGEDFDPAVSSDGSLAYATLRRLQNLWEVAMDPVTVEVLGEPERLMAASWNDFTPSVARSGAVVFSSDRNGNADVFLRVGDAEPRRLTDLAGQDLQPVISPDETRIAFFSDTGGNNDIYVLPLAGGTPTPVTPADSNDVNPYWSPDGTRFGFASDRGGRSEVWTMNIDGSDARRLTDIGTVGHTARWSPDGRWLLFTSLHGGDRNVWAVREDGSDVRQLTHEPTQDAHGLWSADGSQVLYLSDHRVVHATGFADGKHRVLLDLGETIDYTHLSPDGARLLFTRENVEGDIWLIE